MTDFRQLAHDFLICRDMRHSWDPYDAKHDGRKRTWLTTLRCGRCGTLGIDLLNEEGDPIRGRRYKWPKDYRLAGKLSAADRSEIRLMTRTGRTSKKRRRQES